MDIDDYSEISAKLDTSDIDWSEAAAAGLSDGEKFVLTYFSDIESQTVLYLRDMLRTNVVHDSEALAFLTVWNYEEYFHGCALARVLEVCGVELGGDRVREVDRGQSLSNKIRGFGPAIAARYFGDDFVALYFTWGATQELTTLLGYERIVATTDNPALAEICRRIMKQERVHFAWYFNRARSRLAASARAQKLTRAIVKRFWKPVGAGTRDASDARQVFDILFPGPHAAAMASKIDGRVGELPGLSGLTPVSDYLARQAKTASPRQSSRLSTSSAGR